VVGTRPQFVKLSPVVRAMEGNVEHFIIHTGQHYDDSLSSNFFRDLEIPSPFTNLQVGSGSHASQTAGMMTRLEDLFKQIQPNWILIYGDTNSTVAAALVAAKLSLQMAHLEAGLRSHNRSMPEEVNRIIADHLSEVNFAPSEDSLANLTREGLADRSVLVGDVMVESVNFALSRRHLVGNFRNKVNSHNNYLIATFHRQQLTASKIHLRSVLSALGKMKFPVYLAAHPRLLNSIHQFELTNIISERTHLIPPLDHLELIEAVSQSRGVITDSGGLQKEAYLLRIPCITVRPETEWRETLIGGWNTLVWDDLSILKEFPSSPSIKNYNPDTFGDGKASQRILEYLLSRG
jgi:UDP-N-acetylglucosamine 2-epimerase (non-hydrolysing)